MSGQAHKSKFIPKHVFIENSARSTFVPKRATFLPVQKPSLASKDLDTGKSTLSAAIPVSPALDLSATVVPPFVTTPAFDFVPGANTDFFAQSEQSPLETVPISSATEERLSVESVPAAETIEDRIVIESAPVAVPLENESVVADTVPFSDTLAEEQTVDSVPANVALTEEQTVDSVPANVALTKEPAIDSVPANVALTKEQTVDSVPANVALAEEPAVDSVSANVALTKEPAIDSVPANVALAEEPAVDSVPANVALAEEPAVDSVSANVALTEEQTVDSVPANVALAEEQTVDSVPANVALAEEPAVDSVPANVALAEEPAVDSVPANVALAEEQTVDSVPANVALAEEPAVDSVPANVALAEEPAVDSVSANVALAEEPAVDSVPANVALAEEPAVDSVPANVALAEEPAVDSVPANVALAEEQTVDSVPANVALAEEQTVDSVPANVALDERGVIPIDSFVKNELRKKSFNDQIEENESEAIIPFPRPEECSDYEKTPIASAISIVSSGTSEDIAVSRRPVKDILADTLSNVLLARKEKATVALDLEELSPEEEWLSHILGRPLTAKDRELFYWEDYIEPVQEKAVRKRSLNPLWGDYEILHIFTVGVEGLGHCIVTVLNYLFRRLQTPKSNIDIDEDEDENNKSINSGQKSIFVSDLMISVIIGVCIASFVVFPVMRFISREVKNVVAKSAVRHIGEKVSINANEGATLLPIISHEIIFPKYDANEGTIIPIEGLVIPIPKTIDQKKSQHLPEQKQQIEGQPSHVSPQSSQSGQSQPTPSQPTPLLSDQSDQYQSIQSVQIGQAGEYPLVPQNRPLK